MISLRQHVASLAAVLLALAVGLALGGGLLGGGDVDRADSAPPSSGPPSPSAGTGVGFPDQFAASGAPRLYADGLHGHAAAILAFPGADPAQVKLVQAEIISAGGALTGTYTAGTSLLDPAQEDLVESLGSQLATQLADPRIDPAATTYDRMGALMALAMATTETSSVRADLAAVTVRESLASGDLMTSPTDVRNAPLVLVVLPPGGSGNEPSVAERAVLSGLVDGLGSAAAGVVVVGDEASAERGDLAALREGELVGPVSTVDGIDTPIGRVTTVLAMIGVIAGTTGAYGASGSDGAVPLT